MTARVLFVCLHGSAKSVIAAEHCRGLARARGLDLEVESAGLEPDETVPPAVVQGLLTDGIDVRGSRPRRPTPTDVERATVVVSFCDLGDLTVHARRIERWDEVPPVSDDFSRARDEIVARVSQLLDEPSLARMSVGTLLLTRSDVRKLLTLDDCIAAVARAFERQARRADPPAALLSVHVEHGGFHGKAAVVDGYFAAKLNANFPGNPARTGLPTIQGLIALCDATTGRWLAVMDSMEITMLRTGAATALAARHLARLDATTVTVCGCGTQGRIQLEALQRVRPIARAFAYDVDHAAAVRFAQDRAAALGLAVEPIRELALGARQSDIVVTCTPSRRPLIGLADVRPGAFIAAVGADSEDKQELAPELLAAGRLVVDNLEQCATIGELHHALAAGVLTRADVHAELGEVIAGAKPGRSAAEEITIFDSTGTAIQDVAAAVVLYERAREARACGTIDFAA